MYTSSRKRVTSKGLYKEGKTANMARKWVLTREERRGGFSKRGERGYIWREMEHRRKKGKKCEDAEERRRRRKELRRSRLGGR